MVTLLFSGPRVSAILSSVKINKFISLQRQLLFSLMITQYPDQEPLKVQSLPRATKDRKSRWVMIAHALKRDSKNKNMSRFIYLLENVINSLEKGPYFACELQLW